MSESGKNSFLVLSSMHVELQNLEDHLVATVAMHMKEFTKGHSDICIEGGPRLVTSRGQSESWLKARVVGRLRQQVSSWKWN